MGIGISLSGLASAVANMGGIGVISSVGIGFIKPNSRVSQKQNNIDAIRNEIKNARKKTLGVLGVNIMSVITDFSEMVRASIDEGIDIIFSGAGLPLDLPKYLNGSTKTKLVPIVSSARAASILCHKWKQNYNYLPDAFVVEGPLAGGHLGFKPDELQKDVVPLDKLMSDVLEITAKIKEKYLKNIPVIAAGGIYSGNDIFQIIKKGASAVQMGTRFIATKECDASLKFKQAFIQAKEEDIKIIKSPVGMPGRAIMNKFLDKAQNGERRPVSCSFNCIRSCNPKTTLYCIADALVAAYRGDFKDGFAFSGSNGGKVTKISTVQNLFTELNEEYQQAKISEQ